MSVANEQITHLRALDANKKTVTGTYTIRTGRPADSFAIDNPVDIADPAANFTLTLPAGYKMGQTQLVVMSSNDDSKTASLSITNHVTSDPEVLIHNAVDEYTLLIWTGTEWATISKSSTTS